MKRLGALGYSFLVSFLIFYTQSLSSQNKFVIENVNIISMRKEQVDTGKAVIIKGWTNRTDCKHAAG